MLNSSVKIIYKDKRVFELSPVFSISYIGNILILDCQGILGDRDIKVIDSRDIEKIEIEVK